MRNSTYVPVPDKYRREVSPDLRIPEERRAEIIEIVRKAIYDYGDVERLSLMTSVSQRAIYAIRCGKTRWPRWDTLFRLLPALRLELTIIQTRRNH